jgi:hypothetical protein
MTKKISILLVSLFSLQAIQAQPCKTTEDLVKLPGVLKKNTDPSSMTGSTFKAPEKPAAQKTMDAAAEIVKKNFSVQGGEAHYWAMANDREFFDVYSYPSYQLVVAYYQDVCVDGKKTFSSEYTVDFQIRANPEMIFFDAGPNDKEFLQDKAKYGEVPISIFRYLSYPKSWGDKISSGKGMIEDHDGNNYMEHKDAYYIYYITKGDLPLLLPVSRKELLESLLELYEREKLYRNNTIKWKHDQAVKYMAQYEKSGDKVMYQSHLENKQRLEKERAELDSLINIKRGEVEAKLKNESPEWLAKQATHKFHESRYTGDRVMESARFKGFYEGPDANSVYRFNPAVAASKKDRTGEPLFFRVRHRYKVGETFSKQINEGFVRNFDFEALRKLL